MFDKILEIMFCGLLVIILIIVKWYVVCSLFVIMVVIINFKIV